MTQGIRDWGAITFTFQDAEGHYSTMDINVLGDAVVLNSIAAMHSFAQECIDAIYAGGDDSAPDDTQDLTGTALVGYIVRNKAAQTDAIDKPSLFADAEDKSSMLFRTVDGFPYRVSLPGCYQRLQVDLGAELSPDLDKTMFAALTDILIDGVDMNPIGLGGEMWGVDSRGTRLSSLQSLYKHQAGSQKSNRNRG